jgi:hypothetical protein
MTLENLNNEIVLLNDETINEDVMTFLKGKFLNKSKRKVGFTMKDGFAHLDLKGYEKVYITKLTMKEGSGYRIFFKAKGHAYRENNIRSLEKALEKLADEVNKTITNAKISFAPNGEAPERAPADLEPFSAADFDLKELRKALK